jgi:hypothetical protein
MVFKALTELKNKTRNENGTVTVKDLRKHIDAAVLSDEELISVLKVLDADNRIHYEDKE